MTDLLTLIDSRRHEPTHDGKSALDGLGFIASAHTFVVQRVPFHQPCLLLVLAGRKTLLHPDGTVSAEAGELLALTGPASYDMRNEPDARTRQYRALVIPFGYADVEAVCKLHHLTPVAADASAIHFARDMRRDAAVAHYLQSFDDTRIRAHRLLEILLILADADPRVLGLVPAQTSWGQRVRNVLTTDLARAWEIAEVCRHLATSESSLRRHLKREHTGFRELLNELRLSAALAQLLQTSRPIYQVAYDCGYQSVSRFSNNFHKRFGLPPRDLREAMRDSEHNLAFSERSAAVR